MLHQILSLVIFSAVVCQNDDGWLDALINITLSVGWGQHDYAGIALLRKSIDTVVVVLVEHPEVVLLCQICLLNPFGTAEH